MPDPDYKLDEDRLIKAKLMTDLRDHGGVVQIDVAGHRRHDGIAGDEPGDDKDENDNDRQDYQRVCQPDAYVFAHRRD